MRKEVTDASTTVMLEGNEPKEICKLGQGAPCCAFLVVGSDGFECVRMSYPSNTIIMPRIDKGTMNAKGLGGWEKCAWEGFAYMPQMGSA